MTTVYDHRKIREAFDEEEVHDLSVAAAGYSAWLVAHTEDPERAEQAVRLHQLAVALRHANASRHFGSSPI